MVVAGGRVINWPMEVPGAEQAVEARITGWHAHFTAERTPNEKMNTPEKGAAPGSPEILAPHLSRIGDQSGPPCYNVRTLGQFRESEFFRDHPGL